MNDVTRFTQAACALFATLSRNFLQWRRKKRKMGKDRIDWILRNAYIRLKEEGDGRKDERKNKRKKGSRKSSVNSNVNDFKAGKIWWQFRLTIITTTRPHMSRCIRVTRNTLLHSLQRVIYRVQKHAYTACWESLQPFRESSPVSLRSLLRASKESSRVFFLRLNRNLIRIYKRLKKKKRD